MARNRMQGMEYFDHWTTAHNDIKLRKVMIYHGVEGYGVYFYLLERLYSQADYCLDLSEEDTMFLLAKEMEISFEKFNYILEKCLQVGLFDQEKWAQNRKLTSNGVLQRAAKIEEKRDADRSRKTSENTFSNTNAQKNSDFPAENHEIREENATETTDFHGKSAQRKEKKRKLKEEKSVSVASLTHPHNFSSGTHGLMDGLGEAFEKPEIGAHTFGDAHATDGSGSGAPKLSQTSKLSGGTKFVKPELAEVEAYCQERGSNVNAQRFVDFYESKGWRVGNQPMKNWQAAVRTWEQKAQVFEVGSRVVSSAVVAQSHNGRQASNAKHLMDYGSL